MVRRTYHRGLRLKSGTMAMGNADNPWLDDKTTAQYRRSLQRTAALPRFVAAPPPLAAATLVAAPASVEQRANAALDSFWSEQSHSQKRKIMSRMFDPTWVRVLAATLGIALGVTFGWVLVAGPELPSFTQKTKTLVPGVNVALADNTHGPQPVATEEPHPVVDIFAATPETQAPLPAAAGKRAPRRASATAASSSKAAAGRAQSARAKTVSDEANARPATLRINSRPEADVFIDDKPMGPTPQLSISLQPGVHNVRLHNRQRNLLKILTLHVLPGETIDRVEQLDP